ncbi:hypothetical protein HYV81_03110 [Candidatus Woesearchaeota archaeon]|nr:hypothetical protein [Candidatus Woesearchaeota archaeon]
MVIEKLARAQPQAEIAHAIDDVVHRFTLEHRPHETIKEAIERQILKRHTSHSREGRYYRQMLHNEFSASPIPAMVALGSAVMAS